MDCSHRSKLDKFVPLYWRESALLRLYTFYVHKELETVYIYAATGGDLDLSVIPDAFFAGLAATGGAHSSAEPNRRGASIG